MAVDEPIVRQSRHCEAQGEGRGPGHIRLGDHQPRDQTGSPAPRAIGPSFLLVRLQVEAVEHTGHDHPLARLFLNNYRDLLAAMKHPPNEIPNRPGSFPRTKKPKLFDKHR
jgi:hypothetical protein